MQSDPRTISELFERKIRYIVPIFQRHYVWDEKNQWRPLWDDIRDKTIDRINGQQAHPHFMGSVVLAHKRLPTNTQSISAFTVIDGQQRMTTVQLVLAAMREVCKRNGLEDLAGDINDCLFNQYRTVNNEVERFKLWPTRFDQETYQDALTMPFDDFVKKHQAWNIQGNKGDRKNKMRENNILGAYLFFEDTISAFVKEVVSQTSDQEEPLDAGNVLHHVYQALMNDLKIVEIQLLDKDDPQMIFETLNGRGTPLTSADLIRNYIFMRADKSGADMDELYDTHWEEMETPFWSGKVKQGRMTEERLVFFFYNYLLYKSGAEVRFDKIFPDYKSWIINEEPFANVTAELEDIKRASRVYEILTHGKEDTVLSEFAKRLRRWDITAIYPLVMLIELEGNLSEEERSGIYKDLDSYLIRRLICNKTQKSYNKTFVAMTRKLREMGVSRASLQALLTSYTSEINAWPSDGEFEKAWLERAVYSELGSYAVNGILQVLENQDRSKFSEDVTINSALSVEHFMPFSWYENWALNGRTISKEEWEEADTQWYQEQEEDGIYGKIHNRKQLLHSFGNLTLIMQSLNSSFGNEGFGDKRKKLLKHSALALNRYFLNVDSWDEVAIEKRGKHLFGLALEAWPRPANVVTAQEAA